MDSSEHLPLSLVSQAGYCLRRAALILNERVWEESADTARGRAEHERVHTARTERRGDRLKLYEYTVFSDRLGLSGKCDCIEAERAEAGSRIPAADFSVRLYPVEYKHGSVREEREYMLQLCAQAICLEEMFGGRIERGALFYITAHRRLEVEFDERLRAEVSDTAAALHRLRAELSVPRAKYSARCRRCSLREYCMPRVGSSAEEYCAALAAVDEWEEELP